MGKNHTLYNEKMVRLYIREHGQAKVQLSKDFWPALESRIRRILDMAIKRNGSRRRITGGEVQ